MAVLRLDGARSFLLARRSCTGTPSASGANHLLDPPSALPDMPSFSVPTAGCRTNPRPSPRRAHAASLSRQGSLADVLPTSVPYHYMFLRSCLLQLVAVSIGRGALVSVLSAPQDQRIVESSALVAVRTEIEPPPFHSDQPGTVEAGSEALVWSDPGALEQAQRSSERPRGRGWGGEQKTRETNSKRTRGRERERERESESRPSEWAVNEDQERRPSGKTARPPYRQLVGSRAVICGFPHVPYPSDRTFEPEIDLSCAEAAAPSPCDAPWWSDLASGSSFFINWQGGTPAHQDGSHSSKSESYLRSPLPRRVLARFPPDTPRPRASKLLSADAIKHRSFAVEHSSSPFAQTVI
ncbi:hypothetical protein DCS_06962 [Drechmeria coniospora]|uniref:Uncharacterized protein n=1 Tax=Drechmeria coniospora TaxID=98403 RepID=A0A151GD59_DRECN|nr:hypothetical protein DCS_06962 [Drechmeria coniospora]KYK55001.1 hypothetical protein DCS_06962 [Drechmeria coniospora]